MFLYNNQTDQGDETDGLEMDERLAREDVKRH
jgi:hypothetical protein